MGKTLPVDRAFSPYGYIEENLAAVKRAFNEDAGRLGGDGFEVLWRLQRDLTTIEVLMMIRDAFVVNGWKEDIRESGVAVAGEGRATQILTK